MPQQYGLSEAELLIMDMIWSYDRPFLFSEIMDYLSTKENKTWKKQTLHTYLTRLIKKGVLVSFGNGRKHSYKSALSKEEYIQQWTRKFIDESFEGSLGKFILALSGNCRNLSQEDLNELRDFLEK